MAPAPALPPAPVEHLTEDNRSRLEALFTGAMTRLHEIDAMLRSPRMTPAMHDEVITMRAATVADVMEVAGLLGIPLLPQMLSQVPGNPAGRPA